MRPTDCGILCRTPAETLFCHRNTAVGSNITTANGGGGSHITHRASGYLRHTAVTKKKSGTNNNVKRSKKPVEEDYEDDDYDEDIEDDDADDVDYSDMSPKELFKMCKDLGIDARPKKGANYYIKLLEEYDQAKEDWEDEDDDEWEDE